MTLKELSSLFYKSKLIERNKERVAELEAKLVRSPAIDTSGIPRNPSPRNSTEELNIAIVAAKEDLEREIRDFEYQKIQLERFIREKVEDEHIRLILLYRFADLMRWNEIADKIGGNNTEDSVKKKCYRYLKNTEK